MKLGITLTVLGSFFLGAYLTGIATGFATIDNPEGAKLIVGQTAGIVIIDVPLLFFGIRRIQKAIREQEPIDKKMGRKRMELIAFKKENCGGCRFADENTNCLRPRPPEVDSQYCYSREQKENEK
jgi:hypothetical protein